MSSSASVHPRSVLLAGCCALAIVAAGCSNDPNENKRMGQIGGALIGAVAGAALGGDTGGKILAGLGGAALGAWLGGEIGKALTPKDKDALAARSQEVAGSAKDGETIIWNALESKKEIKITPANTRREVKPVEMTRISQVSIPPGSIELIDESYEVTANARLRATPNTTDNNIIGSFQKGDRVTAGGRTKGQPWLLVQRQGKSIGYVSTTVVKKVEPTAMAGGVDLDAKPQMAGGLDLDSMPSTKETVQAETTCRDVVYDLDKMKESVTSCRAPDGAWKLG